MMKKSGTMETIGALFATAMLIPACCMAFLDIDPLRSELSGAPGVTLSGSLTLTNLRQDPMQYDITAENANPQKSDSASWLHLSTNKIELLAGETRTFSFTIDIPKQARGELLGRIGFAEATVEASGPLAIRTKISVPVHILVEGTVEENAVIREVRVPGTSPLQVEIDVENLGNVLLHPKGACSIIQKPGGQSIASFPVNKDHTPLYTGVNRTFLVKAPQNLAPGTYEIDVQVEPSERHPVLECKKTIFVPNTAQTVDLTSE